MLTIEIEDTQNYSVSQDYRLYNKSQNRDGYNANLKYRYKFSIVTSLVKEDGLEINVHKSLSIYSLNDQQVNNTLVSKLWTYRFITKDNLHPENNYKLDSLQVHKYYKNKKKSYTAISISPDSILKVIKEFDQLDNTDKIEIQLARLKEENSGLKTIIRDFKTQLNNFTKRLKIKA
jgi:hypothetical protein